MVLSWPIAQLHSKRCRLKGFATLSAKCRRCCRESVSSEDDRPTWCSSNGVRTPIMLCFHELGRKSVLASDRRVGGWVVPPVQASAHERGFGNAFNLSCVCSSKIALSTFD